MQTLSNTAIKILLGCMVQWNVEEMDDAQMKNTSQLITYFDNLPYTVRDQMLTSLREKDFWDNEIREPQAWDVVPFLYQHQRRLNMWFSSPNFDLEFLLKISGHKLKNLTDLHLPLKCSITTSACKRMCHLLPNLQKLRIFGCVVEDDSAVLIAQLPLVELHIFGTTQVFVRTLCAEDSALRKTLRVFQFDGKDISAGFYCFVLNTMTSIEDMGKMEILDCSRWLKALLPLDTPPRQYELRKLYFASPDDSIEDELDIAVLTCPKARTIHIYSDFFTLKMLLSLTKFKELTILCANMEPQLSGHVTIGDINDAFDRISLRHLYLENLVEFSMDGPLNVWLSSGYFFHVLDMCPNLEKLKLSYCCGFSDKIARKFAELMAKKKLKRLQLDYCDLLGTSAIEDLFKIGSLLNLDVQFQVEMRKLGFNVCLMQETAERHGVNMQIGFLSSFNDDSDD